MLYKFTQLAEKLNQLGYSQASQRGIQIIRRDLSLEEQAGNLDFRADGIYLNIDGIEYKGYMYLKLKVQIAQYGLPKFHITNCSKVREERAAKRFHGRYFWYNSNVVSIEDRPSGRIFEDQVLELCNYCLKESDIDEYNNTEGFRNLLDAQEVDEPQTEIQLDMFNRPLDWDNISKAYRQEKNYTCEKCGFGGDILENRADREFIHTDHIVAWELANMRRHNLQCLCILCHSEKDDVHRRNFSKPGMQKRIKRFIDKYRNKLDELGNKYLDNY